MKFLLVTLFALSALADANRTCSTFPEYADKYGKVYKGTEIEIRAEKWANAKKVIDEHNARFDQGLETFTLIDNDFADMTDDEKEISTGTRPGPVVRSTISFDYQPLERGVPQSLNLTNTSCMPPVKNQGHCGSCYSFAALNPIEYQHCVRTGHLVVLSEQQIVSCSTSHRNMGCKGGWYYNTWEYIFQAGGVASSTDYPYNSMNGTADNCTLDDINKQANVMSFAIVLQNETVIKQALATYGPIAVSIYLNEKFNYYASGVYKDDTCSTNSTGYHAVTLVGYGTDPEAGPYWIARNSWGTKWGMQGYILMARDVNQCGVAEFAAFPMFV